MIELFAVYNSQVPADISRLEVWDVKSFSTLSPIISMWQRQVWQSSSQFGKMVSPPFLERNGKDVVAQFETSIVTREQTLTATDGATITNKAKNDLDIVYALEGLY